VSGRSFADDLGPRKAAHLLHLLVDLLLRRLLAEDATEVVDFRRDELVVFEQKANHGVLKVAFQNQDNFGRARQLVDHETANNESDTNSSYGRVYRFRPCRRSLRAVMASRKPNDCWMSSLWRDWQWQSAQWTRSTWAAREWLQKEQVFMSYLRP